MQEKGEEYLAFLLSLSVHAELQRPKFSIVELDKQVTMANSTKDPDTSLALAQEIMLLNNVADFTTEGSEEIRDLFVMQQVQVRIPAQWLYYFVVFRYLATCLICFVLQNLKRATTISERMKQQSSKLKKLKKKMRVLEFELNHTKLSLVVTDQLKLDLG